MKNLSIALIVVTLAALTSPPSHAFPWLGTNFLGDSIKQGQVYDQVQRQKRQQLVSQCLRWDTFKMTLNPEQKAAFEPIMIAADCASVLGNLGDGELPVRRDNPQCDEMEARLRQLNSVGEWDAGIAQQVRDLCF